MKAIATISTFWHLIRWTFAFSVIISLSSCDSKKEIVESSWCDQEIRVEFSNLPEITTSSSWFKVYDVGEDVLAIAEPYNYQEVISYLILGNQKAVLFDTGMGLDSMSLLVKELTNLPITVINSHTHYDHIGSNHEFDNILLLDTAYSHKWAKKGWPHNMVEHEVAPDALCSHHLPNNDFSNYKISPFKISDYIQNGSKVDLGDRTLEVINLPGHTPDALGLIDRESGYLWTGDTFYEATIWLFFEGTDLLAYEKSTNKLSALAHNLTKIFPAHNTPIASPQRLIELDNAFHQILSKEKTPRAKKENAHPDDDGSLVFEFEHFSFLIGKEHLEYYYHKTASQ